MSVVALCAFAPPLPAVDFGRALENLKLLKDAVKDTDVEEERAIGHDAAATLLGATRLVEDRELQHYVNRVGMWLALQSDRPELAWRFAVLDNDNINAFAAPGGYVFVTKGLLVNLNNEAELAGVLAHEIAHVVKKHHLKALKKDAGIKLLGNLTQQALERKGHDTERLAAVAKGVKVLYARGLDKQDEYEADRLGVVLAARAGYDPYGLPAVLQMLDSLDPGSGRLALLFKTHPKPADRLARLDELMAGRLDAFADRPHGTERFIDAVSRLARPVD
ncbi:MAG TPA: M48 family metalloprotease [Gammaproteobacteria bacterium]|nr:M48 family metalloprotease [Gammaproteobacteria bacterium]